MKKKCLYCGEIKEGKKDEFDAWSCKECAAEIDSKLDEVIVLDY